MRSSLDRRKQRHLGFVPLRLPPTFAWLWSSSSDRCWWLGQLKMYTSISIGSVDYQDRNVAAVASIYRFLRGQIQTCGVAKDPEHWTTSVLIIIYRGFGEEVAARVGDFRSSKTTYNRQWQWGASSWGRFVRRSEDLLHRTRPHERDALRWNQNIGGHHQTAKCNEVSKVWSHSTVCFSPTKDVYLAKPQQCPSGPMISLDGLVALWNWCILLRRGWDCLVFWEFQDSYWLPTIASFLS